MSTIITGVVNNGVVVPSVPLAEGARVQIEVQTDNAAPSGESAPLSSGDLLKLPREQRRAILAAGAASAEELYRTDKELMGFDAFSEELDDDSDEG